MSFSYNPAILTDIDFVRFKLGDIDGYESPRLEDEEIQFLLDAGPNKERAAIGAAKALLTRLSRSVQGESMGSISVNNGYRFVNVSRALQELEDEIQGHAGIRITNNGSSGPAFRRKDYS